LKVHYISHLFENSGWGRSCRELIRALYENDVELTVSPVILSKTAKISGEYSFINNLVNKDIGKPEYVIQHILPHYMQYNGNYKKNVGIALLETSDIRSTKMSKYLEVLDEVWICNKDNLINGLTNIKTIPFPVDTSIVNRNIAKMNIPEIKDSYKFYTVCEYSRRKNIWAGVRSFFKAFHNSDNVCLIIKIFAGNKNPQAFKEKLEEELELCKRNCGVINPPEVYFITEFFDEEQLLSLHKYCDCFILPSFGEAWSYPMVDSLMFGKPVITSRLAGPQYLSWLGCEIDFCSSSVDGYHGELDRIHGYHTIYENCQNINENDMSLKMKKQYSIRENNLENNLKALNKISFENVGRMMCEQLVD
jgi:glycosyltransferase involved in cell wall biosynthesis